MRPRPSVLSLNTVFAHLADHPPGARSSSMEDRKTTRGASTPLGDLEDSDSPDAPDVTLGGYMEVHERPPAFTGSDEQPYTASVEVESVDNLAAPYVAYLVFPRWAGAGLGIVGHVETPVLWEGRSRDQVRDLAHALKLSEVKHLLDEAIQRKRAED